MTFIASLASGLAIMVFFARFLEYVPRLHFLSFFLSPCDSCPTNNESQFDRQTKISAYCAGYNCFTQDYFACIFSLFALPHEKVCCLLLLFSSFFMFYGDATMIF